MEDNYYIDLEQFSLERFKRLLETKELSPGRRILKEDIPERFGLLASLGINNMKELTDLLKSKDRAVRFAQDSGLPLDYVIILRREANSYLPKPVNLKDIPGVNPAHIERLAGLGIKNSKQLFERGKNVRDRAELSRQIDVPGSVLLELVGLSDLVRISGVGPVFARIIFEAGTNTLEKLSNSSADKVFEELIVINDDKGYTKAKFTLKDVRYCISAAKELPRAIEYD
jgi:predicted flap endonuclease-1-like 5' DNA nuclease